MMHDILAIGAFGMLLGGSGLLRVSAFTCSYRGEGWYASKLCTISICKESFIYSQAPTICDI